MLLKPIEHLWCPEATFVSAELYSTPPCTGNKTSPMQLQTAATDTGRSPFSSIGRGLEDKVLDIIAAVKQQQERSWHPRMMADVQLPKRFGEPYAAVISLPKQGPVEQIRLSGLQVGGAHLLPGIAAVISLPARGMKQKQLTGLHLGSHAAGGCPEHCNRVRVSPCITLHSAGRNRVLSVPLPRGACSA